MNCLFTPLNAGRNKIPDDSASGSGTVSKLESYNLTTNQNCVSLMFSSCDNVTVSECTCIL